MSAEEKNGENVEELETENPKSESEVSQINPEKAALEAVEMAQKEILYVRAEFENYKKRIQKEQEQAIRFANKAIVIDLLNVVDLFDRAIQHSQTLKAGSTPEVANFVSGVEMTRQELYQLLQRYGVEFVGTVGEKFDPELHEAVSQMPSENGSNEGVEIVSDVVQKGCKLQGKLVKPARVVVGRK